MIYSNDIMKGDALYKINSNLSILCILILIGSILTTVTMFRRSDSDVLAQNASSSVDISNSNNSRVVFNNITKYTEVIKYYDKALSIDPNATNILNNKGIVLLKLGKYDEAIKVFDKILSLDPKNVGGLYNKSIALVKLGKPLEAKVYRQKALQINPKYHEDLDLHDVVTPGPILPAQAILPYYIYSPNRFALSILSLPSL
jgi:tetratricopeptide (TPR) repeat protein